MYTVALSSLFMKGGFNAVGGVSSIATGNKSVLFGDMSAFYVRKVGAPSITVLRERFAPDVGVLGYIRFDGCLSDTGAIKALTQA